MINADTRTKIDRHFNAFKALFDTDDAYHLMVGYLAALCNFEIIRLKDFTDCMEEVNEWYGAEVCKL